MALRLSGEVTALGVEDSTAVITAMLITLLLM